MTSFQTKRLPIGVALLASSFFAGGAAASAQAVRYPSGAVVQSLNEDPGSALARHLRDLSASPRNLTSLLGAGSAALAVGDPQTALTFFARAEEVAPRDGRIKAGMGSAFVQTEQAQAALKFFAEAVSMGAPVSSFANDRGLAYDMIGDPARAQADYAVALQFGGDPEVERRLALSKAISGDREGALAVIEPQVSRGDRAGYRARAFVLALTGDAAGAARAVEAVMPAQANAMRPFLAMLPQLGNADQAMAVHFGRFPANAQAAISANRQYAQNQTAHTPTQTAVPTSSGRPESSQPALGGTNNRTATRNQATQRSRFSQPSARNLRTTQRVNSLIRLPEATTSNGSAAAPGAQLSPQQVPAMTTPRTQRVIAQMNQSLAAQPQTIQPQQSTPAQPAPDVSRQPAVAADPIVTAQLAPSSVAPEQPVQTVPSQPAQAQLAPVQSAPAQSSRIAGVDFNDVVEAVQALPAPAGSLSAQGPVRLAEAFVPAPAKAAAKPAAKPAAEKKEEAEPTEPRRIWVQIAAAQDKSAFSAEFKRLKRKAGKPLASQTAWTAPLGRTNRLLVGPFKTEKEARDLVNELSKVEIDSYSWVSDAGEKVEKLPAK